MMNYDAPEKTAILLIHGIGTQNRYDLVGRFTDALLKNEEGCEAKFKEKSKEYFLGRGVAIEVELHGRSRRVDIFECYWSPLMTGTTHLPSVVMFLFRTLYRMLPWNMRTRECEPGRRAIFSLRRWLYAVFSLFVGLGIVSFFVYWSVGAFFLATDRAWLLGSMQDSMKVYDLEFASLGRSGPVRSSAISKTTSWLTKSSKLPARTQGPPRPPWLSVEALEVLEGERLYREALAANRVAEQLQDDLSTYSELGGSHSKTADRARAYLLFAEESSSRLGDQSKRPSDFWPMETAVHFQDKVLSTIDFMLRSITYPVHRYERFVDTDSLPLWPEPWHALRSLPLRYLAAGALLALLLWTVFTGSCTTLFHALTEKGRVSWLQAILSIASILILSASCLWLSSVSNEAYLFALAVLILRCTYSVVKLLIVDTMGDIEVYAQRDANSSKYGVRNEVLERATETIRKLCESDYQNVIVIGHSLGSVIGLEALRRMYDEFAISPDANLDSHPFTKITSFLTVGSPLEKFALFFTAGTHQRRFDELNRQADEQMFKEGNHHPKLHSIELVNFWTWYDIVSDPLGTFPIKPENDIEIEHKISKGIWPHSHYWYCSEFQQRLAEILVEQSR